jgi:ketosteroid isomerase-like protein
MSSLELVQGIYAAFAIGDVPTVLGSFDAQIKWQEAEGTHLAAGNPYVGPEAILNGVFMPLIQDIDNFVVQPATFTDGDGTILVEGRYNGTIKSTGATLDAPFAHVWRVQIGKAVSFQQYTNSKEWSRHFPT